MDRHLVVSTDEVHFGENYFSSKMGGKVLYVQDWVPVQCRCVVKAAVVAAWTPPATRLWGDVGGANDAEVLYTFKLRLGDGELGWIEVSSPGVDWCASGGDVVFYPMPNRR